MKRVAIVQSNYIPWKGYFDLINMVDEFILFDDRQYTRRDWRNRNRIKTPHGTRWLTIPVRVKGRYQQRIDDTLVSDQGWPDDHWAILRDSYRRAAHFEEAAAVLEPAYAAARELEHLSRVNRHLLDVVSGFLGIATAFSWSSAYEAKGAKTERLVSLCKAAGATHYISGPRARDYMEEDLFAAAEIEVSYVEYDGYPEYDQSHPPFEHNVSIVDLLFATGRDAPAYMKTFR